MARAPKEDVATTKKLGWPKNLKVRVLKGKPDLRWYDYIVVSTSGGKDSQTVVRFIGELAKEQGVTDRLIALHADLGPMVEWPGAGKLAREQSELAGYPVFEQVTRIGGVAKKTSQMYRKGEKWGDLLDMATRKGEWPADKARYCTSDFKRAPILGYYTTLSRDWNKANKALRKKRGRAGQGDTVDSHGRAPCRILEVTGMRASEAPRRSRRPEYYTRIDSPQRRVDTWMAIKWWTDAQVWSDICESGVPYHPAYDRGMDRLSCVFCFYAKFHQLVASGYQNPKALDAYIRVEDATGKTFRDGELGSLKLVRDDLAVSAEDGITPKRDSHAGCGRHAGRKYGYAGEWVVLRIIERGEVSILSDRLTQKQAADVVEEIAENMGLDYESEVYPLAWQGRKVGRKLAQEAFCACPADSATWPVYGAPKWPWGDELPEAAVR